MKSKRMPILTALVGAFLVLSYWALSLLGVVNVGKGADIGGGVILLAGYVLILCGIVSLITVSLTAKCRHKD